jgi:serine/threonine-protein kinase
MAHEQTHYPVGDRLPGTKYVVVRKLGQGGMGVVLEVVKEPKIRAVAKIIHPHLASDAAFRRRFFDEVRILAELNHPNIVRVTDYDELADGTPYFVMELLQGSTVKELLKGGKGIPPPHLYEIMRGLLEGLAYAHTHEPPIVHRDVKSANVFVHVPPFGEPCIKVIDFGVAGGDSVVEPSGRFVGTFGYAAPEQIRGERVTAQADLYSAALILYEGLAGRGPFDDIGDSQNGVERLKAEMHAHLHLPPPSIRTLAPWVPAWLDHLLQSALAKNPRDRPESAYAFAAKLLPLRFFGDSQLTGTSTLPTLETLSKLSPPSEVGPGGGATVAFVQPRSPLSDTVVDSPPAGVLALKGIPHERLLVTAYHPTPAPAPPPREAPPPEQPPRPRSFAEAEAAAKRAAPELPSMASRESPRPKPSHLQAETDAGTSRSLADEARQSTAPSAPRRRLPWVALLGIPLMTIAMLAMWVAHARHVSKAPPNLPAPAAAPPPPVVSLPVVPLPPEDPAARSAVPRDPAPASIDASNAP